MDLIIKELKLYFLSYAQLKTVQFRLFETFLVFGNTGFTLLVQVCFFI